MTFENGYVKLHAIFSKRVEQAEKSYARSGMKRDKEHLEYLKKRLKRYTI